MNTMRAIRDVTKKVDDASLAVRSLFRTPPKLRFYYGYYCKYAKIHPNRILLESFNGRGITDSTYAVLREMIHEGIAGEYEIFYASNNLKRDQRVVDEQGLPITLVDINSRKYPYILATSKYLLGNNALPAYYIRRPEQVYVQMWHGTPLKTLGKQMRKGMQSMFLAQHNFLQANWLTYPNDFTRDAMMHDYNMDTLFRGKVAMVGYPRNAVFLREPDQTLRSACGLDGTTNIAYMPTWRGASTGQVDVRDYICTVTAILEQLDARLTDGQRLYVNFHSMVAEKITLGSYRHIAPFPKDVNNYDFLAQMDMLVTDYSSVLFDYALTGRPIVLFCYDEAEYLVDRGMYLMPEDLPFPVARSTDELCSLLENDGYTIPPEDYDAFRNRFLRYDTANNAKDVLRLLLNNDAGDLPVIDFAHNAERVWNVVDALPQAGRKDLDGLFRSSDQQKDLVVVDRKGFGVGKSIHVYDRYRDYNYIFTNRATPMTLGEAVGSRVSASTKDAVRQREQDRLLGSGFARAESRNTYVSWEPQTTYTPSLDATAQVLPSLEGNALMLALLSEAYTCKAVVLITGRTVLWGRELTPLEVRCQAVSLDLPSLLANMDLKAKRGLRPRVCILANENATGKRVVLNLATDAIARVCGDNPALFGSAVVNTAQSDALCEREGIDRASIPILHQAGGRSVAITPYLSQMGYLSLFMSYEEEVAEAYSRPQVTSVTIPSGRFVRLHIKVSGKAYEVTGVELRNRNTASDTRYELPYRKVAHEGFTRIHATFDPTALQLDGLYFDLYLVVRMPDGARRLVSVGVARPYKVSLFFRSAQCCLPSGNVLFPHAGPNAVFTLCHRELTPYDTPITRVKEWGAMAAYVLLRPMLKQRRIWLVYEKFCSAAQDNGARFFEYCMDDAPSKARDRVFYVLKRESVDYERLSRYGKNVVDFMSFRHMLYILSASILVASDARSHLYVWRPKLSVITKFLSFRPIFFLQHGVMAMKRVDYLFGTNGTNPMTYFLTSSEAEQEVIVNYFGYDKAHTPVLGQSRWDVLEDRSSTVDNPFILLMPTWRQWLEGVDDQSFVESDYFNAYKALMRDERLHVLLRESGLRLKFFMHPKFGEQVSLFQDIGVAVDIVPMGSTPLGELIANCKALVTDYSSVAWDVLYMDKPVLFYQFDQVRYNEEIGAYVDLNKDLPGPVCMDVESLLARLKEMIDGGFVLSDEAKACADHWIGHRDKSNRKRTYDFIVGEDY